MTDDAHRPREGVACQCGDYDGVCTYFALPDRETTDDPTCDECIKGNHEGHEGYEKYGELADGKFLDELYPDVEAPEDAPGMPNAGDGGMMDEIITALHGVGGSEPMDIASVALAMNQLLRKPTRDLIEEWLDMPAQGGLSVREKIASGQAAEVAQHLWAMVDDTYKATA